MRLPEDLEENLKIAYALRQPAWLHNVSAGWLFADHWMDSSQARQVFYNDMPWACTAGWWCIHCIRDWGIVVPDWAAYVVRIKTPFTIEGAGMLTRDMSPGLSEDEVARLEAGEGVA